MVLGDLTGACVCECSVIHRGRFVILRLGSRRTPTQTGDFRRAKKTYIATTNVRQTTDSSREKQHLFSSININQLVYCRENKVAYELLTRKLEEANKEKESVNSKYEDAKTELEDMKNQLANKDYQLGRMATKLLKYKEKLSCIELKLVKYDVQRPGSQSATVLSVLKKPANGRFWLSVKDEYGEKRIPLPAVKKVQFSDDKPLYFNVFYDVGQRI